MSNDSRLRSIDAKTLWHPFTQMQDYAQETPPPPIIVAAEGNWLIAQDGRRYLDANSGYWCLTLGCRPLAVERALHAQLEKFSHSTLLGLSHVPALELADRLSGLAGPPLSHVFFADSGSEAVEVALKMAYQYQVHRGQPQRSEFLALGEAYHGDTLGAVAVGGVDLFHATFKPLLFPVRRVPPPHCYRCPWKLKPETCAMECASAMETAIAEHRNTLAAVVIEPFLLGPGGLIPQPNGYLERVVHAAKQNDVTVIFDEVAVGMGRLGTIFAFEQLSSLAKNLSMKPDIVCLAKGLTAGLMPLSATLASDTIYQAFLGTHAEKRTFFHGHTFTGSALGCAAALAALDQLSAPGFLETLREKTIPAFWRALEKVGAHPNVGSLRGRGMMAGAELVRDRANRVDYDWEQCMGHRVVLAARKRGINTRAIGNLVLAVPPLTITLDEIEFLSTGLRDSIEESVRT